MLATKEEILQAKTNRSFGKVGVLLGGKSHEREISLKSGEAVFQALLRSGVDAIRIDTGDRYLSALRRNPIDLAFIALHGFGGEDGTIQRVLERLGIPYIGSTPKCSLLAFDKIKAKKIFEEKGIPTPSFRLVSYKNLANVIQSEVPPYVIKPNKEGSSIGVLFVERKQDAHKKLVESLKMFDKIFIEQKIIGREFTVGILGDEALPVIELKPKRKFYDFKAKYTKGLTEYLIPAPIDDVLRDKLQELALQAHRSLGLRDLSRVDFIVDEKGTPYALEVNSIPGFTETSLLPKAAREIGYSFDDLCIKLLTFAHDRKKAK